VVIPSTRRSSATSGEAMRPHQASKTECCRCRSETTKGLSYERKKRPRGERKLGAAAGPRLGCRSGLGSGPGSFTLWCVTQPWPRCGRSSWNCSPWIRRRRGSTCCRGPASLLPHYWYGVPQSDR
jgi:hypothetical protein